MKALRFDIQTVSEANKREHWAAKYRRKKSQQHDFSILWKTYRPSFKFPATVTFTRYACKAMDTDNLAGAFKHVQDALANELGIDDGHFLIHWKYEQEVIARREHYFTVTITEV